MKLETRYPQKRVLITGANSGFGKAMAMHFGRNGWRVAVTGRRPDAVRAAAEDVRKAGAAEALELTIDVAKPEDFAQAVERIEAQWGGLDILVNNAGVTKDQLLLRMTEDDFDRVIDVNLKGTWNFLKASSRALMKNKGRVVNIGSIVGLTGNAGQANYAASKAGVVGLTKSMAKELAGRGVCVNCVAPGYVATDMTAAIDPKAAEALKAEIPLGRIGDPDDIARAVEFLVGPGGDYVTGQTLVVDGGMSL